MGWVEETSAADITIGTTVRPAEVVGYDEPMVMTERSYLAAPSTAGSDRGRLSRHEAADREGFTSEMKTAFSVTTRIQATPARVFWFLADPSTASVIDPAVVSYEPEGGIMGLGVRNHIRVKMLGIPVKLTSETIEWEPGSRMGFRSITPGRPVIGVATHVFEPCSEGTLYTWSMDFLPTGFGGRVAAALSAALLGRNAIAQGERVRRVLEAAAGPIPRQT